MVIAPAWTQQQPRATLEGSAVNRLTGVPLKNARLALQPEGRPGTVEFSTSSASNGTLQFQNVDSGKYLLFAERTGYESQFYTASDLDRQATLLTVATGDTLRGLTVKLTPHSVITGRVLNEDGDPVAHASVQAFRSAYVNGKRQSISEGQATTDDLGEYRIFELAAGKYTVQAKAVSTSAITEKHPLTYVPVFYPNAENPRSAVALQLAAGQVQARVDFQLHRVPTVSVQGRIAGADGEAQGLIAYIFPSGASAFQERESVSVQNGQLIVQGVLPGNYTLVAEQLGAAPKTARVELNIRDRDLQDVVLNLVPAAEVRGRIQREAPAASEQALQVSLQPLGEEGVAAAAQTDATGAFRVKSVRPGLYQAVVYNLRPSDYVKSIRVGDQDITEKGLDLTRGSLPGDLIIQVSPNGGVAQGIVQVPQSAKPGGIQVFAIPTADRVHRAKAALTDQSGHFEIKGLAPGEYRVYAFEDLEPGAAEDAEFLKQFSAKSRLVTIKERAIEALEIPVIPATLTHSDQ